MTFKRKRHYLGMHVSEEAAARAYDQGAICLLVRQSAGAGGGGGGGAGSGAKREAWWCWSCRARARARAGRERKAGQPRVAGYHLTASESTAPCMPALSSPPPRTQTLPQGMAAATNFPLSMYDVQTLTSQDITQVAARLKARKRGGRGSSASTRGGHGGRGPRSGGKRKRARSDSESCGETEEEEEEEGEGDGDEEDEDEDLSEEEEESL